MQYVCKFPYHVQCKGLGGQPDGEQALKCTAATASLPLSKITLSRPTISYSFRQAGGGIVVPCGRCIHYVRTLPGRVKCMVYCGHHDNEQDLKCTAATASLPLLQRDPFSTTHIYAFQGVRGGFLESFAICSKAADRPP